MWQRDIRNAVPQLIGEWGYLTLLEYILEEGVEVNSERTGTGTIMSRTPHQLYFPNVEADFPLFTTKYVSFNMLACEMLWFISGSTHIDGLKKQGSSAMADIWSKWDDGCGSLGPVYGKQWREWESFRYDGSGYEMEKVHIDQLQEVIDNITKNPTSRRHIVTAWNPADLERMALPPCHVMYQFTAEPIEEGYRLHLHMLQRSADALLGLPFNIAQYSLLLQMVSQVVGMKCGDFTWTGVNCHIYQDHVEAVQTQIGRDPKSSPMVILDSDITDIDDFEREHIHLAGYDHCPKIEAEVSV